MQLDAKALAAETADIVQRHVAAATAPLLKRIEELEARKPEVGEKGDRGEQGGRGEKGLDGSDGIGLAAALIDREGKLVVTMTDGSVRELGFVVGRDGKDGVDGKDGAPGRDGRDGSAGEKGEKGDPGESGRDGRDAYAGEARGLFDANTEYRARDVVALGGSAFMAKRDNPGECPGDGWMLLAQRGKRGEQGEKGDRGEEGKAGKDGAVLVALTVDIDAMQLRGALSDGDILEADIQPLVETIIQAVKEG